MSRRWILYAAMLLLTAGAGFLIFRMESGMNRKNLDQQHALDQADQILRNIKETQPAYDLHPAVSKDASSQDAAASEDPAAKEEPAGPASRPAGHPLRAVFVGDSRTVGMEKAEKDSECDCIYIGMSGEGYDWFYEEGCLLLEDVLREDSSLPVIYNLGVNDCSNISHYLSLYRELEKAWPNTDFYYLAVNPVTDDSFHVTNDEIDYFNSRLKAAFGNRFWDSNAWLRENGCDYVDGVHYSEETYRDIHDFALKQLPE